MTILHISILFLSLTPLSFSFSERCHPSDKKALLQIKKDLNNPSTLITWRPESDCCSDWHGVYCYEKTNRTRQLDIPESDLQVPIPAAVGDLPCLYSLSFYQTNVTGEIPQAISKLSNLTVLNLRFNLLTGPIPDFLRHLKNLRYIGLTSNSLTGSIPASLSQLPELDYLLLNENKLTGSIPESLGDFKKQDFNLDLSHNQLSGPIPRKLGSVNFNFIRVSSNRLEGDLSALFGTNKRLTYAFFSSNLFEFNFSKLEFPKTLRVLDLSHNKIYGSIPEGLTKIDLDALNLSYNRLCGEVPVGGILQEKYYTNYIHNKCLCGSPLTTKCKSSYV